MRNKENLFSMGFRYSNILIKIFDFSNWTVVVFWGLGRKAGRSLSPHCRWGFRGKLNVCACFACVCTCTYGHACLFHFHLFQSLSFYLCLLARYPVLVSAWHRPHQEWEGWGGSVPGVPQRYHRQQKGPGLRTGPRDRWVCSATILTSPIWDQLVWSPACKTHSELNGGIRGSEIGRASCRERV